MTFTLRQLQEEQRPWVKHNFGGGRPWMPLLGIGEEVGEFISAKERQDRDEQADALADMVIFAADYCSEMGWDLQEIKKACKITTDLSFFGVEIELAQCVFKMHHHHLKLSQGIRTSEQHEAEIKRWLGRLLHWAFVISNAFYGDLLDIVEGTWAHVKKRDWKKDAAHGGEV